MTLRLAKGNDSSFDTEGPFGTADPTEPAAVRAGLFLAQELALLGRGGLQRPFGQPLRCRGGDFLHVGEIHVEPWSLIPESALDDDFSPLLGEAPDFPQFFRRQLPCCHGEAILDVRETTEGEFPSPILSSSLYGAKGVLHSGRRALSTWS